MGTENNIYINYLLEDLRIHNEVKKSKFNNIINVQIYFKNNIVY